VPAQSFVSIGRKFILKYVIFQLNILTKHRNYSHIKKGTEWLKLRYNVLDRASYIILKLLDRETKFSETAKF
jgi:hypothetical protein